MFVFVLGMLRRIISSFGLLRIVFSYKEYILTGFNHEQIVAHMAEAEYVGFLQVRILFLGFPIY